MDDITRNFLFRNITPVPIKPPDKLSGLDDRFFFTGSCFSDYLFRFLKQHYFRCVNSPFGNTYNPFSIARTLTRLIDAVPVDEGEVFEYNGLFRHFDFHTEVSRPDKTQFISHVNGLIHHAASFLKNATVLLITFGTAYAYFYRKTGRAVNNCHTVPGKEFERRLLSKDEITGVLTPVLNRLKENRENLHLILTLSPVRHLRDRAEENTLSKAVLCCAINELLCLPDIYYFPSYEIMLDELRDYRYYGNDLCHPNETAVRYIMQRFCQSCLDREAAKYLEKVILLKKACAHKPRHPETEEYRKFAQALEQQLDELRKKYPGMPLPETIKEIQTLD